MKFLYMSYPDINNGIGLRVTLWLSGCSHHCYNCQNPQTWDYNAGRTFEEKDRKRLFNILKKDYIDGITFSGGDPLYDFNVAGMLRLVSDIKQTFPTKTIWLYTGFTWEQIFSTDFSGENRFSKSSKSLTNTFRQEIIKMCDVIIDGEYVNNLRDVSLPWRGSKNQRVIDVQASIKSNKVISVECD